MSSAERDVRLKYLLDELDLTRLAKSKAYTLSGGEKRRLEITRALVTSPKLLLLDEPLASIDPIAVYEVQKIVRRLRDRGLGVLITDHQVRETLAFELRDWLRNDDLFDYGMSPQFLSRFDAVLLLDNLSQDELVRIFLEVPDSAFHQTRAYFESRGIHLAISPAAVRRIAVEASRQPRLGARALKEAFRRVVRDYEFDPRAAAKDGVLFLDVAEVEAALGR